MSSSRSRTSCPRSARWASTSSKPPIRTTRKKRRSPRTRSTRSTTASRPAVATKKEAVDRTDDPVRMYLREMGAVELLPRRRDRHRQAHRGRPRHDDLGPVRKPDHLQRHHRMVERPQRRHDAAARDPRPRGDAVEGPDRRADQRERGRRRRRRRDQRRGRRPGLQGRGRAGGEEAAASDDEEDMVERRAKPVAEEKTTTTPSPSPRWKRR